jgi:hypothetical protein
MSQEHLRTFRIRYARDHFFMYRDSAAGKIYGTQFYIASARLSYDAASAIAARLGDLGYDDAEVTDFNGRTIGPDNDRPSAIPKIEVEEVWGEDSTTLSPAADK